MVSNVSEPWLPSLNTTRQTTAISSKHINVFELQINVFTPKSEKSDLYHRKQGRRLQNKNNKADYTRKKKKKSILFFSKNLQRRNEKAKQRIIMKNSSARIGHWISSTIHKRKTDQGPFIHHSSFQFSRT